MQRRDLLRIGAGALMAAAPAAAAGSLESRICLFTDHLGGFEYLDVARMLSELKVTGPDLTVRGGGLVKPDRVLEDLPKAARIFKDHGLTIPMITTNVTTADAGARTLLSTAAKAGVKYYKVGYYPYKDLDRWKETIDSTRRDLQLLAKLNQELNIQGGVHNHAGNTVGCDLWDSWEALQQVDPARIGFFFDPAHAAIEGGGSGWKISFRRLKPRLFMVALKDYVFDKTPSGYKSRWVPLGQGMVRFPEVIQQLKAVNFPGPISLHIEYDPGGSTKTQRYDRALEAAAADLRFLRKQLQEASA